MKREIVMKLKLIIEGTPLINKSIHYTKKGVKYKPGRAFENDKYLRASIINLLPFEFKPFKGLLRINVLHFVFPPPASLSCDEMERLIKKEPVCKLTKPDFIDCLDNLTKALIGSVLVSYEQICEIKELKKYYSIEPKIEIEIEEL